MSAENSERRAAQTRASRNPEEQYQEQMNVRTRAAQPRRTRSYDEYERSAYDDNDNRRDYDAPRGRHAASYARRQTVRENEWNPSDYDESDYEAPRGRHAASNVRRQPVREDRSFVDYDAPKGRHAAPRAQQPVREDDWDRPQERRPRESVQQVRRHVQKRPAVKRRPQLPLGSVPDMVRDMIQRNPRLPVFAGAAVAVVVVLIILIVLLTRPAAPDAVQTMNEVPAVPTALPTAVPTPEPVATMPPATQEPVSNAVPAMQEQPVQPAQKAQPAENLPSVTMVPTYQVLEGIPNTDGALGLPESVRVDDSYFNDTVFIGDSVSKKLTLYVTSERKRNPTLLGNAEFLTTQSFSSRNALKAVSENSLHPTYNGVKMTVEDAVAAMGAKKVYIMLGLNDVGISGVNDSAKNLFTLLKKIKEKSPDVLIFVQSATPRLKGDKPTTEQLFQYNLKVYEYCQRYAEYGIYFVDVAYIMRDAEGKLYPEYCSDADSMALHFNNEACAEWVEYLYTHALV